MMMMKMMVIDTDHDQDNYIHENGDGHNNNDMHGDTIMFTSMENMVLRVLNIDLRAAESATRSNNIF